MEIINMAPGDLIPYKRNAKKHPEEQVAHIANSIREFGFRQPIVIDGENVVVIGHGRLLAALKLGLRSVPCVRADDLTPAQVNALRLADNKTNESEWDFGLLDLDLAELSVDFDMSDFGFEGIDSWFDREEKDGDARQEGNDEYNEFLEKFELKKTTDDCYTPENIYEVVCAWVEKEYGAKRSSFVRPFYPGGDYQNEKYPRGCVVVDNPPFSILAEILDYYLDHGVKFFLFAPGLQTLNYCNRENVCAICLTAGVTYENGAVVSTSFLTNLGDGKFCARSAPDLLKAIKEANEENDRAAHVKLPKYEYPDEVLTASKIGWFSKHGQALFVRRDESAFIRELDAMKQMGKSIFGTGLLISEQATAERVEAEIAANETIIIEAAETEKAAAERAATEMASAVKWQLSDREREIVKQLGQQSERGSE